METPVAITRPRRIAASLTIDTVSLSDAYSDVHPDTICRTCVHSNDRLWKSQTEDYFANLLNNVNDVESDRCEPVQNDITTKTLATTGRKKFAALEDQTDERVVALIDSCGHQILPKCNGCQRFVRETISIPYTNSEDNPITWTVDDTTNPPRKVATTRNGTPPLWWKATIGGHCSIPSEGMMVKGQLKYCDPVKRVPNIEPSCSNCAFLDRVGDSWMYDHLSVNGNARLTPYERYRVHMDALEHGENTLAATNIALWAKQTKGRGLIKTMKATVLYGYSMVATQETRYLVKYDRTNLVDKISTFDKDVQILSDDVDKAYIIVELQDNRLYPLGYKPTLRKFSLVWPNLPEKIKPPDYNFADPRINEECAAAGGLSRCSVSKNRPCYFHAKVPEREAISGEVTFFRPGAVNVATEGEFPPHGELHLRKVGSRWFAIDGNGNMPQTYSDYVANAAVFRRCLNSLLESARKISDEAYNDILQHYRDITSALLRSTTPTKIRPYWLAPSTTEPSKPRCTHPNGMDLRKVFGDTFGLERVDFDFDLGSKNTIEVEEELRVGYRQHEFTPQQLQEEIMVNLMLDPNYVHSVGGRIEESVDYDTDNYFVTQLPLMGDFDSTQEMADALNDQINYGGINDVDGNVSVPRYIDKRQQLFGYALVNKAYGKRKGADVTQLLNRDPDYLVFDHNFETSAESVKWICDSCDGVYGFDEVDMFNPECETCGTSLYRNHFAREVVNPRARGGVGNVYVKANDPMVSNMQLGANLCSNWVYNQIGSKITYETIFGAEGLIAGRSGDQATKSLDDEHVEIVKVNSITSEQAAINKAYMDSVDEVVAQRTAYLEDKPSTTPAELARLFPTPGGTIYQEKAAGSLSKMG